MRRAGLVVSLVASLLAIEAPPAGAAVENVKYRTSRWVVAQPSSTTTVKVACPKRTRVIGGGAKTSGGFPSIVSMAPYDNRDRDRKPDDGWLVTGRAGSQPSNFQALAGTSRSLFPAVMRCVKA